MELDLLVGSGVVAGYVWTVVEIRSLQAQLRRLPCQAPSPSHADPDVAGPAGPVCAGGMINLEKQPDR